MPFTVCALLLPPLLILLLLLLLAFRLLMLILLLLSMFLLLPLSTVAAYCCTHMNLPIPIQKSSKIDIFFAFSPPHELFFFFNHLDCFDIIIKLSSIGFYRFQCCIQIAIIVNASPHPFRVAFK